MDTMLLLKFVSVFGFVIGLMLLFSRFLQKLGSMASVARKDGTRRLSIIESMPLDPRRRLVLVRRDDQEHLLVLGHEGETVVETNIPAREENSHVVAFARDPRNVKI